MNAAAFPLLQYKYAQALKKLKEAESKIEKLSGQGPGVGRQTGGGDGNKPIETFEDWAAEARKSVTT